VSILGTILSKILGRQDSGVTPASGQAGSGPAAQGSAAASSAASGGTASGAPAGSAGQAQVDVAPLLDEMASERDEELDWRHSIVDLMKLLGLDSSLEHRRQLASELHYTGDTGDTASMNIWLHKQVMQKLAENGGKVPQDLMH
jgi:Domain of unknown function (DUF3597)